MNPLSCHKPTMLGRMATSPMVAALGLVLVLAGCGPSPQELRAQTAQSRSEVLALSREVLRGAATVSTLRFTDTKWIGCDDFGGKVRYEVFGRLEPATQSGDVLLDAVADALASRGMRLTKAQPLASTSVTRQLVRDGIDVTFYGYQRPHVNLSITGPCLDAEDFDDELIERRSKPLRLDES